MTVAGGFCASLLHYQEGKRLLQNPSHRPKVRPHYVRQELTHQGQEHCRVYCRGLDDWRSAGRMWKSLKPGITASAFIQAKITEFRKGFIQSVKILWLKLAFFVYCIDLSSGLLTRTFNVIE